jgi:hypothetical protein
MLTPRYQLFPSQYSKVNIMYYTNGIYERNDDIVR